MILGVNIIAAIDGVSARAGLAVNRFEAHRR